MQREAHKRIAIRFTLDCYSTLLESIYTATDNQVVVDIVDRFSDRFQQIDDYVSKSNTEEVYYYGTYTPQDYVRLLNTIYTELPDKRTFSLTVDLLNAFMKRYTVLVYISHEERERAEELEKVGRKLDKYVIDNVIRVEAIREVEEFIKEGQSRRPSLFGKLKSLLRTLKTIKPQRIPNDVGR